MSMQTDLIVIDRRGNVSKTKIYSMAYGTNTPNVGYMRSVIEHQAGLKGQHPPITVTAANSSLLFFSALKNTVLPQVRIEFYRPDPSGSGELQQFYTIILTDATITSKGLRPIPPPFPERVLGAEQIEIAFRNIEWAYNTSQADCWSSQD